MGLNRQVPPKGPLASLRGSFRALCIYAYGIPAYTKSSATQNQMSYSLNSLKGGVYRELYGGMLQGLLRGILGV